MPPDEFKTQVLLLHRELSTLENLSEGFGHRYTVHCATSGSEALSTLGETPINVIVSAQDLPGMSGIEALREAKKRSPDTIGILIDDGTEKTLQAVVGNEEVFQVVRGNVTRKKLLQLVDEAAKKLRLMTLSVSANDTAANIDDTGAEHIVMETTQSGLSVITDSSGRVPILNPQRAADASDAKLRAVDLLILTRDSGLLETIKDSCRAAHTVHYASTLSQADQAVREFPVGVAVIDAGMIGNKIEKLTEYLRKREPRLVPIVAGRRDDGEMLMDMINHGKVYRFLLKPVSAGRARLAIDSSAKFHLEAPQSAFDKARAAAAGSTGQVRAPSRAAGEGSRDAGELAASTGLTGEFEADAELADAFADDGNGQAGRASGFFNSPGKQTGTGANADNPAADSSETQPASSGAAGSPGKKRLAVAAGVAAAALLAATFYWFGITGDDGATVVAEPAVSAPAELQAVVPGPSDQGAVVLSPAEQEAVVQETGSEDTGQESVIAEALAAAETALLESRLDDADTALQQAAMADPENQRLPALNAQLSEARQQQLLREAQSAILDYRFEDASAALAAARSGEFADESMDTAAIDLLETALIEARAAQRIDTIVAAGNARLQSGALLAPAEDNARYFFELALAEDPNNNAARLGLGAIAGELAVQARAEIGEGRLGSAEALLAAAKSLDPSGDELAAVDAMLVSRREAIAELRAAEAANQRAAAASVEAAPPPGSGATDASESAAESGPASANDVQPVEPVEAVADAEPEIPAETENTVAAIAAVEAGDAAVAEEESPVVDTGVTPAAASADPEPIVAMSSLKRTKYVAPRYPRAAVRRNLSGWVDVTFTVATDGTVTDIETGDSEPGTTFVNAAAKAVAKWQFEPVIEDGVTVEKRAGIRMMFAVE